MDIVEIRDKVIEEAEKSQKYEFCLCEYRSFFLYGLGRVTIEFRRKGGVDFITVSPDAYMIDVINAYKNDILHVGIWANPGCQMYTVVDDGLIVPLFGGRIYIQEFKEKSCIQKAKEWIPSKLELLPV